MAHDCAPNKKPRRGHTCPNCHKPSAIHSTRSPAPDLVVRYRWCPSCDWRVTTEERVSKHRRHGLHAEATAVAAAAAAPPA